MIKRRSYSGDFKARVVSQYIRGSKSLDELALEFEVHPNQIKNWKHILMKRAPEIFDDRRKRRGSAIASG
jgi:transposase-like protein